MLTPAILLLSLRNPVSSGTHLLWCLWSLYVTAILWRLSRDSLAKQISVAIFGLSMVLLYGASGLYHALNLPAEDLEFYRMLDHSAIYVLIAGTYTPVCVLLLRGKARVGMLVAIWGLTAAGIACKWLLPLPPYWLTVGFYILMGWLCLLVVPQMIRAVGYRAMGYALLGGIFYTVGGVADALKWPAFYPPIFGAHELLHVMDMAGTMTHVYFITRYVIPYRAEDLGDIPTPDEMLRSDDERREPSPDRTSGQESRR